MIGFAPTSALLCCLLILTIIHARIYFGNASLDLFGHILLFTILGLSLLLLWMFAAGGIMDAVMDNEDKFGGSHGCDVADEEKEIGAVAGGGGDNHSECALSGKAIVTFFGSFIFTYILCWRGGSAIGKTLRV